MSVANIVLEPHRARLISDTVGYRDKEPASLQRKVHVADKARIVFTARGLVMLGDVLEDLSQEWTDFEAAIERAAAALRVMPATMFPGGGSEVTMLGWHQGGPKVSRLLVTVDDGAVSVRRIDLPQGVYLAPSLGKHQIPAALTDEQILKVAHLQQDIAIRHGLNICVGGDVEVTTIDATGITVRKIGEYPNKAQTIAKMNENNFSAGAGELYQIAA